MNETNYGETNQVHLVSQRTDKKNISQFDLAYIDVGGEEVLAAFDSCSTATLIHRKLIDEGTQKRQEAPTLMALEE